MVKGEKGGKRHFTISSDAKWFAHPGSSENKTQSRETCTSTGIMLTQSKSSSPRALNFERYPKSKTQQKSREYPGSYHDNKHSLKDDISVFTHGVGRRKCLDDSRRQHNSHFCLCHDGADSDSSESRGSFTSYQTDFMAQDAVNVPTSNRLFPRNHQLKSVEAGSARAGEQFMWFGRHDSDLSVPAATDCRAAKQQDTLALEWY